MSWVNLLRSVSSGASGWCVCLYVSAMYLLLRVISYLVSWSYLWFVSMSNCA